MGVEPNLNSDATADSDCGCVNCPACCAANALQGGRSDCPALASLDANLQRVVGARGYLPGIRITVGTPACHRPSRHPTCWQGGKDRSDSIWEDDCGRDRHNRAGLSISMNSMRRIGILD